MKAGVASTDITPKVGAELSGFLYRVQPSVGVHDPLRARALYLEGAGGKLLWVHADLVGFDAGFVREVRPLLAGRCGLSPEQVVMSATHTHSGPATVRLTLCGKYDESYLAWLKERLIACAGEAAKRAEPALPVFAEGTCGLAKDRRNTAAPHVDHRVAVMAWQRTDGSYAAVLANYPMHNVGLGSGNRKISGDIAGLAASAASRNLPGAPEVLLLNGACGNINPPQVAEDYERVRGYADVLAGSMCEALSKGARPLAQETVAAASQRMRMPLQTFRSEDVKATADRLRQLLAGEAGYGADRYRQALDIWEKEMGTRAATGRLPASVDMEVQLVQLGDVYLVCLGAEVFSRMADDLRNATGKRVYVVGYANGCVGYLPTPEAFTEDGYETGSAFVFYGSLPPRPEAYTRVLARAAKMID